AVCPSHRQKPRLPISSGAPARLLNNQSTELNRLLPDAHSGPACRVNAREHSATKDLYQCCSKEDVGMRTTSAFTPLFRSSIGFDRMLSALEAASRVETIDNWPPYDIAKTGEDDYRITMAVAGFSQDELTITQEQNMLMVSGQK